MHNLYYIVSPSTNGIYVGITKNSLRKRFASHKWAAKSGKKTHLYNSMRKHKDFCIVLIESFNSREDVCDAEVEHIAYLLSKQCNVYNHTSGGETGFDKSRCCNIEEWKEKLRAKRKGRTPALGITHTEENKKLFGEYGKLRWDIYGRYPDNVTDFPFRIAKDKFGISKTHYYRLRRAKINDLS